MKRKNPHPIYWLVRYIKATGDNAPKLQNILDENKAIIEIAKGSQHNHQVWPGGYIQHVVDTIRIAQIIYNKPFDHIHFAWSSVVLVLFLHDIEKPFMQRRMEEDSHMPPWDKSQRQLFRAEIITQYDLKLTQEELDALFFIEGEDIFYSPTFRKMNELGALCHAADVLSARLWHSSNKPEN